MKLERPEIISTIVAVTTAVATVALVYWSHSNALSLPISAIFVGLLIGILVYGLGLFLMNEFIYEKVKIIYKNIHELKLKNEEEEDQVASLSSFEMVERDVADWAEERKNEIRELKERESFRREFIGNVSHELKTPIFNIQGYILTLLDGAIEEPEINVKYLQRANKSVERMIALVQDMDAINKLESGILDLELKNFDIAAMVRDVFEMLESNAKEKRVQLDLYREFERPVKVYADPYKIEQVLLNLVTNAIRYSKEKGRVEIRFFDMDDKVLVEVTDNGLGIPEKDLSRIFERFYRVDKSRTREAGGSGLGLAIVKHILDVHKQTINVRSTVGVGSTFSFTLQKGK
ncbi:MAG: sensor histidine kinase [Schleiferiaceae bacterium]|nr:sensor histidine kinase [Schleiferiaceae bacterium]